MRFDPLRRFCRFMLGIIALHMVCIIAGVLLTVVVFFLGHVSDSLRSTHCVDMAMRGGR